MTTKAPCKFCGQINLVNVDEGISDEDLIQEGTLNCNCIEANELKNLKTKKEVAYKNLELMFNNIDEEGNGIILGQEIMDFLKRAIDLICLGTISKHQITIKDNGKISISNKSGKIKVEHQKTNKIEMVS